MASEDTSLRNDSIPPNKSSLAIESGNDEGDGDEDDDDQFGNFEEAANTIILSQSGLPLKSSTIVEEVRTMTKRDDDAQHHLHQHNLTDCCDRPSCSRSTSMDYQCLLSQPCSSATAYQQPPYGQYSLVRFIERNNDLWIFDTSTTDSSFDMSSRDSEEEVEEEKSTLQSKIYDLFTQLDRFVEDSDCSERSTSAMENFQKRSLEIWSHLHCVDEALALQFTWKKSSAFAHLLAALDIRRSRKNDGSKPKQFTTPPSLPMKMMLANSDVGASTGMQTPINRSEPQIDSLSVEPVNFDWQSSGLSNPLTGSSISAISAVLECKFLATSGGNNNNIPTSKSIMERELKAFGLSNGQLYPSVDKGHSSSTEKPRCKNSEEELSISAKKLYDRLPNYEYMLPKNTTS